MFLKIATGAIGIGIILMLGFLIIAQVKNAIPPPAEDNPCYGLPLNGTCTGGDNTSMLINDSVYVNGIIGTQNTVYIGLGIISLGIIILAAFGLINVFK